MSACKDYTTSLSDKNFRKFEGQQQSKLTSAGIQELTDTGNTFSLSQSRLCPERGQEANDCTDAFSLPQYIRVMVSNYQPLQTIFAIAKGECQSEEIRPDEQFSPTVTIVDTATQQTLDCVLLLHGEKPPEVTYRTLFCHIAVQVSYCDAHGSPPYPLYHVESKPCKQSKLPLTFCFHQPGTVCVIQLSIHSIVDSEGVEYMHRSENCTCVVQIIDRDQKEVLRMKEPTFLRFTGPLATKQYLKQARQFKELYLSGRHQQIQQFSKQLLFQSDVSVDIKVFSLCWQALSEAVHSQYESAEEILKICFVESIKTEL